MTTTTTTTPRGLVLVQQFVSTSGMLGDVTSHLVPEADVSPRLLRCLALVNGTCEFDSGDDLPGADEADKTALVAFLDRLHDGTIRGAVTFYAGDPVRIPDGAVVTSICQLFY